MDPPQLLGLRFEFDGVLEDRVIAVPLREILSAHEGTVLGRAAVVVPQIEVEEVDRVREGGPLMILSVRRLSYTSLAAFTFSLVLATAFSASS